MDQFIGAYRDAVLNNYANFSGRLSVGGFWRFVLVNFVISIAFNILGQVADILGILALIYGLAVLIPGIAATVRRLHDTGKPGIYVLVGLIPCVGFILLIIWTVAAGQPQPNQYGPPPAA